MKPIIIAVLFCVNIAAAQTANKDPNGVEEQTVKTYEIPFGSKGNEIELSVANSSGQAAEDVKIEVVNVPEGIKFTESTITIEALKAGEEKSAAFSFSVDKTAQIKKEQTLSFNITDKTGQSWTKDIKIKITPPATFELLQNYPNPFNPTTTIEYSLPASSGRDLVSNEIRDGQLTGTAAKFNVSLKVYDVIGREVVSLVNEQQEPGFYQKAFDAGNYASGVYIYRLVAVDGQNNKHTFQKKMILLK